MPFPAFPDAPQGAAGEEQPLTRPALRYTLSLGSGAGSSSALGGRTQKKGILKWRNKAGMSFRISSGFGTNPFWGVQKGHKDRGTKPECPLESARVLERTRFLRRFMCALKRVSWSVLRLLGRPGTAPLPVPRCGTPFPRVEGKEICIARAQQLFTDSLPVAEGRKHSSVTEKVENAQKVALWEERSQEVAPYQQLD